MTDSRPRVWLLAAVVCLIIAAVAFSAWFRSRGNDAAAPQPGSAKYEEYVSAFSIGVAAIDVTKLDTAQDSLTKATDVFAGEPAAWADLGLLAIRDGRMDDALHDLKIAESLTPADRFPADASTIQQLLGVAEQKRGKLADAIGYFRKAVELEPKNIQALYRLAKAVEEQHEAGSDAEIDRLMDRILELDPQNVFVLQNRLRVALQRGDRTAAQKLLDRFKPLAAGWPKQLNTAFNELEKSLADPAGHNDLAHALPFLNLLKGDPAFSPAAAAVDEEQKLESLVLDHFIVLAQPKHTPAEPDAEIQFVARPLDGVPEGKFDSLMPAWLDDKSPPVLLVANSKQLRQIGGKLDLPSIA
ncbi:MAG TPA: tetratricopeptide repeat protein, partial [Pirellulales bacterium]|nr:tetratricopeptide repeat protein [Pirellulales bacterium]